jgi:hypothetical protein
MRQDHGLEVMARIPPPADRTDQHPAGIEQNPADT